MGKKSTAEKIKKPSDLESSHGPLLKAGMGPTKIRRQRGDVAKDLVNIYSDNTDRVIGHERRWKVQSPLAKYLNRGEITDMQFRAGEQYRAHAEGCGVGVKSGLNFDAGGGDPILAILCRGEAATYHSRQFKAAERAMGPLTPLLRFVAIMGGSASDWAKSRQQLPRAGITVLRLGLDELVKFFARQDD